MKKLLVLTAIGITFASCEKGMFKKEKECPVLSSESVPAEVKSSFTQQFSGNTVKIWFNKDDKGYCALFIKDGKETLAYFDKNGSLNKTVNADDNDNDDEEGCECETEND